MKIKYKYIPFFGTITATYKGIVASLAKSKKWISIYTIQSHNRGKGEVNEFIKLLKKDYPNKVLWSSVPLNPAWQYIADKHGIKYKEGGE